MWIVTAEDKRAASWLSEADSEVGEEGQGAEDALIS